MTFAEAIKSGFKNMTKFEGRSTRSEYWWFVLFYIISVVVTFILVGLVSQVEQLSWVGGLLILALVLAFILPSLSLAFRRLHDTDHSGWWLLLYLVPFGGIVLLVFYCTAGTPGDNKYGPGPLGRVTRTFE